MCNTYEEPTLENGGLGEGVQEPQTQAQEGANQPKELNRMQYGKLMHQFFTVTHSRVKECGHKFHPNNEPRTNCEYCWFAYFNQHGEIAKTADEAFRAEGKQTLVAIRGEKFTKMFLRFMATIAKFKAEEEKKNEGVGRPESGSGETCGGSCEGCSCSEPKPSE